MQTTHLPCYPTSASPSSPTEATVATISRSSTLINSGTAHGAGTPCHVNGIEYSPEDQTIVFSDLDHDNYTKVTLTGQVVWVLGGSTSDFSGDGASWSRQHGFGLGGGGGSLALEVLLNTSNMTATLDWQFAANPSISNQVMGDVQRLPNGNTLVSYSTQGRMLEVDSGGSVVQDISWGLGGAFGYVTKRPTLYGPPPK